MLSLIVIRLLHHPHKFISEKLNMIRKKMIILAGIVVILLAAFIYHHQKKPVLVNDQSVDVTVQKVKVGSIPLTLETVGTLIAAKSVKISPEISAKITKILFKDGSFVEADTPLIQFDNGLSAAKLNAATADLDVSIKNYERMQILAKKGVISKQEIEKAYADLQEKKSSVKEIQVLSNQMLLVAPFAGVLDKAKVSEGNFVTVGQELVTLTDTHHLHIEYTVPETFLGLLKADQTVSISSTAFPNKQFIGKVSFIAPTINTQDRTVSVYAEIPNDDQTLLAGMFVQVIHSFGEKNKALLIPALSLMATIDGQQVYKVVDGKALAVPVTIGQRNDDDVQVVKGLTANDEVIVAGQFKIKDGTPVKALTSASSK
jgi:membrane fusion protein (multidrug efflux system)